MPLDRRTSRRAFGHLLRILLLVAVAASASWALSPRLYAQRIPYGDADLGTVAAATIKAGRDYDIPDEETTRKKREDAVASVRAVYEHDVTVLGDAVARVRDGFAFGRRTLADLPAEERDATLTSMRDELERRLGARLEDAELAALARDDFPETAESAVVALVTGAMRELIVGDAEELSQHRERGIAIVRRDATGRVREEVLSDVGGIHDLPRVRELVSQEGRALPGVAPELRRAVAALAQREVRVNLKHDPDLTRQRRESASGAVKPVVIQLKKGEKIIGDGERIDERHLLIFRGMRAESEGTDLTQVRIGGALLATLLVVCVFLYGRSGRRRFEAAPKDLLLCTFLLCGALLAGDLLMAIAEVMRERAPEIPTEAWTYLLPFAAAPMLVRFVLPASFGFGFVLTLSVLVGLLGGSSLQVALFVAAGGLAGAARVAGVRDRSGIFRAGAWAGAAQAGVVICFALFSGQIGSWDVLLDAAAAFVGGGLLAPVATLGLLAVAEGVFDYTTDLRLLELANLNHPALKELIVQAPGTYHHSIIVGTLVEAAAERIGANPLLAKVCAYYHDLGKGPGALNFGENQKGHNRHDDLPPEESARVIIEHVARGLEIARKYKLPKVVADAIPEHHGTRLVGFFFHKAKTQAADGEVVDEAPFRYAGPKPQSRETALIMMGDAVEAASRAMQDPTPEKLRALVDKLIAGIAADGQLDECDLELRDLPRIAEAFCASLEGLYHSRPAYPPAATRVPTLEERERKSAG